VPWGKRPCTDDSIDYLNHPACSWIDQDRPVIDNRVTIARGNAIFPGDWVKDYPGGRQDHSNLRILAVAVRRAVFAYHIVVKARGLIGAQQAANPARDTANHATDRATHGPAYGAAFGCATFRAAGNSLSLGRDRRGEQSRNHGYFEFFCIVMSPCFHPNAGLNIGLRQKFPRRGAAEIRIAGQFASWLRRKSPACGSCVALAKFRGQ
jgi:hypothetical protein